MQTLRPAGTVPKKAVQLIHTLTEELNVFRYISKRGSALVSRSVFEIGKRQQNHQQ
jgi:hypothetical protein